MILEKYYDKEIVSSLLETYINVRYYNYYEAKCKSQEANINYYMKLKTIYQIPLPLPQKQYQK